MNLSNRIDRLKISPTRRYNALAKKTEAAGTRVLRLSIGQPDLAAPDEYFHAMAEFPHGTLQYSNSTGLEVMRQAQANYYTRLGLSYQPEEIFVTAGATEAIQFALLSLLDPGDELLLLEPFYTNYSMLSEILGVQIRSVMTSIETNYSIPDMSVLEAAVTSKTKAILFSNPGNPTGRVYTREELDRIVALSKKHHLSVISDEVYREFNFSGHEFISIAEYDEIRDQLVLLDSASKKYACCGSRIGTLSTKSAALQAAINKLCNLRLCSPTLEQYAIAQLGGLGDEYFLPVAELYRKRRDALAHSLDAVEGISYSRPEGAFYTLVRLPVASAEDFVVWMLEQFRDQNETILLTPAEGFYFTPGAGIDEVRISYCVDEAILKRAIEILHLGLEKYQKQK
ncbi:MAG: pyridoxal phosphate-dependent aminotransferase [Peptoniphilaceae bacterium]|nr:pyridoxal phosphate-dependent aminotransferase [Peptoniphilaceae bacterium]MDY5765449.1 pyridoxal phosphate-dependent aminotransferase [Peptoniphilaceae bacterium]